jgi:hypothetical protein
MSSATVSAARGFGNRNALNILFRTARSRGPFRASKFHFPQQQVPILDMTTRMKRGNSLETVHDTSTLPPLTGRSSLSCGNSCPGFRAMTKRSQAARRSTFGVSASFVAEIYILDGTSCCRILLHSSLVPPNMAFSFVTQSNSGNSMSALPLLSFELA